MPAIYFKMLQQYIYRKVKNEMFTVTNLGEGFSLYYYFNLSKIKKRKNKTWRESTESQGECFQTGNL